MKHNGEEILFIEYENNIPFSVITDGGSYEFELCSGDLYCYNSGSGGREGEIFEVGSLCQPKPVRHAVWIKAGCRLKYYNSKTKRYNLIKSKEELLKMGYILLDEPIGNPFDNVEEIYEGFTYCKICDEHMIDSDENYCRHLFYSEGLMGVGSNECSADAHKESFFKVLDKTQLAVELKAAIISGKYETSYYGDLLSRPDYGCRLDGVDYGSRFTDDLTDELEEAMLEGVGWLDTLEPGVTKEAEAVTIGWIDEWIKLNSGARERKENTVVSSK